MLVDVADLRNLDSLKAGWNKSDVCSIRLGVGLVNNT